jgi:predicted enzyme related to lactoylglutathione lyase
MAVDNILAVVCVSDPETARRWYEQLFGRPADTNPMGSLLEWQVTDTGWLQVFEDPERAGKSFLTLATDDLDEDIASLGVRGLTLSEVDADPPMRLATIEDPDGNQITFGQHLKGH